MSYKRLLEVLVLLNQLIGLSFGLDYISEEEYDILPESNPYEFLDESTVDFAYEDYDQTIMFEENELDWSDEFFPIEPAVIQVTQENAKFMDEMYSEYCNRISNQKSEEKNNFKSDDQAKDNDFHSESSNSSSRDMRMESDLRTEYTPVLPDSYNPNETFETGRTDDCHYIEKPVYHEECLPYLEQLCFVRHQEQCHEVPHEECVVKKEVKEEKKCFNVEDEICELVEVEHEPGQNQTLSEDAPCSMINEVQEKRENHDDCLDVSTVDCWKEEEETQDYTCSFSVEFKCGNEVAVKGSACVELPHKKCYTTPRKLRKKCCEPKKKNMCEKLSRVVPEPVKQQNCSREEKTETAPGSGKFFKTECRLIKKEICGHLTEESVRTECSNVKKKVCEVEPKNYCEDETKKFCHTVKEVVKTKICPKNDGSSLHIV